MKNWLKIDYTSHTLTQGETRISSTISFHYPTSIHQDILNLMLEYAIEPNSEVSIRHIPNPLQSTSTLIVVEPFDNNHEKTIVFIQNVTTAFEKRYANENAATNSGLQEPC